MKSVNEKAISRQEQIQSLQEKLKKMENIKIKSEMKNNYYWKNLDLMIKSNNKRKESELLPQTRRPKAISEAHKKLVEARGENYEIEPYDNFLGK